MATATTLQEKFLGQLPFLLFSEQKFVEEQTKLIAYISDPMLKTGMQKHLEETKKHVTNLEQVFFSMGKKPETKECPICMGLVKSTESGLKEMGTDALRDAHIGGEAALMEHYEIGAYRGLIAQAEALGLSEVASLMKQNLQDEEKTVQQLESAAPMMLQKAAAM